LQSIHRGPPANEGGGSLGKPSLQQIRAGSTLKHLSAAAHSLGALGGGRAVVIR
jgi:hypothetical protein